MDSPSDNTATTLEHSDIVLDNAHSSKDCYSQYRCTLHNRSNHHMRSFPQFWNSHKQIMERFCSHGYRHTDPDEISGFEIHNCDGCCAKVDFTSAKPKSKIFHSEGSTVIFDGRWAVDGLSLLETVLKSVPYVKYGKDGYSNYLFEFRGTCKCESAKSKHSSDCEPNFIFKNLGIKMQWDKTIARNTTANVDQLDPIEWYIIINACIQSLRMG